MTLSEYVVRTSDDVGKARCLYHSQEMTSESDYRRKVAFFKDIYSRISDMHRCCGFFENATNFICEDVNGKVTQ